MKAGTFLLIFAEIIGRLHSGGFVSDAGDFNINAKDLKVDTALYNIIADVLKSHGYDTPDDVDAIVNMLPLFAHFVK